MKKPKRKRTAAERRARKKRREEFMTIFIHGKQKTIRRPPTVDGMPVDEFIRQNADPVWLHQNELWEYMEPDRESHMSDITLNLVVLRSPDVARAVAFYSQLGLQFCKHRHGSGPEHFSAELAGGVFELYPLSADGASTLGTRIGFRVPSVDAALAALSEYPAAVVTPARDSEWGRRAVVADPDGHRVELLQL